MCPSLIERLAKRRLKDDPTVRAAVERRRGIQENLTAYRFRPVDYIVDKLGWTPWAGIDGHPGQLEIIEAYRLALLQQHERREYEAGKVPENALRYWQPGEVIQNWIHVEAGHAVGKTKVSSGLVNHFFDTFVPSIIYCFAPTYLQVHDLLFKEIKADRRRAELPGRILEDKLDRGDDHFAKIRATDNSGNSGTERAQGQHGEYLMFVLDEAEGVADYVFDAVESMTSGGISIVLMLANPRTRISRFHKAKADPHCAKFTLSCVYAPNVLAGREIVPNTVRREYVDEQLAKHAERVDAHDEESMTFTLPWRPEEIYRPDPVCCYRVLGQAPITVSENTLVPSGLYETAVSRQPVETAPEQARMGVDCARFGTDMGTLYIRHNGRIWRAAQFAQQDTMGYAVTIRREARALAKLGVTDLQIRVDGTGGYGAGVIDWILADEDLRAKFQRFDVVEVHFNSTPYDESAYADKAAEMYGEAAGVLRGGLAIIDPPNALEADLTERRYKWTQRAQQDVKRLEEKDKFKKRIGRSPDDGDGFVLAAAPDYVFWSGAFIL